MTLDGNQVPPDERMEGEDGAPWFPVRLQKFLARAGVDSRRACEKLITAGRVEVNGRVVTELGSRVFPQRDEVCVDGIAIAWGAPPVTIAMNKPADVVTTMSDPQGRRCIADLMPTDRFPGLYPVGRLDRMTTGLILCSTDGELGNNLLHPRKHVMKTYHATVEGRPDAYTLQELREGVLLDDGITLPAMVEVLRESDRRTLLSIQIREGRKNQVRRMCRTVGHPCLDLNRVSFGPIQLGDLPQGRWRPLTDEETAALYACTRP